MRIAYVCADRGVPAFGWEKGCSIHVQEIIRAFKLLGHSVDLYTSNASGDVPDDLSEIEVHALPHPTNDLSREKREQAQVRGNAILRSKLDQNGPYDLIYERYSLWSYAGMDHAACHEIPGVLEVNSPLIEEQNKFRGLVDTAGAKRCAELCFDSSTSICAVSDKVRAYLTKNFDVRDKVAVIPNGVDPYRFDKVYNSRRTHGNRFTVGFVGSLKPWHGLSGLLDAFALVQEHTPDSHLLIVGDGPERGPIESQIKELGLSNAVTLAGARRPAEIPDILGEMDVGVAPYPKSSDDYFSPMKVFEYMAAGLPVVASSTGQLEDIITDECNGLLCEPGNTKALADALMCLKHDPALRMRLGRSARRKVLTDHTWLSVASRILQISEQAESWPSGAMIDVAT